MNFYLDLGAQPIQFIKGPDGKGGFSSAPLGSATFRSRDAVANRLYFARCGEIVDPPAGNVVELVAKLPGEYGSSYLLHIEAADFTSTTDARGKTYLAFDFDFSGAAIAQAFVLSECGGTNRESTALALGFAAHVTEGDDAEESQPITMVIANNYRRTESASPAAPVVADMETDETAILNTGTIGEGAEVALTLPHVDTPLLVARYDTASSTDCGVLLPAGSHSGQLAVLSLDNTGGGPGIEIEVRVSTGVSPGIAQVAQGDEQLVICVYNGATWVLISQQDTTTP